MPQLSVIEPIDPTTYRIPMSEGEAEIGDSKAETFKPHLKLVRLDGKCIFELYLEETGALVSATQDSVKWASGNMEASFYSVVPTEVCELGAVEFDITLLAKPLSNKITFKMKSNGVRFAYQPPLTDMFADGWHDTFNDTIVVTETQVKSATGTCYGRPLPFPLTEMIYVDRPEEVVGSYSVRSLAPTMGLAKAFHLLRPKIVDADGKWAWSELHIAGDTLTVTMPQKFLDTARYPVSHAAGLTIGYTGAAATNQTQSDDFIISSRGYTPTGAGTGVKIGAWLKRGVQNNPLAFALYLEADDTLVAYCDEILLTSATKIWMEADFKWPSTSPELAAVSYRMAQWCGGGFFYNFYHDSDIEEFPDTLKDIGDSYVEDDWPDPVPWTDFFGTQGWLIGMTCEYELDAPPSVAPDKSYGCVI